MNTLSDLNPVSRWLDVSGSVGQGINTLPMNVVFSDMFCDQDYKLLIGDIGSSNSKPKLKVFKGTSIVNDIMLPDTPTALVSFYTTESVPRNSPVIAVSMGSSIFIYKNMKLFYKFYLPPLEIQSLEAEVWRQFSESHINDDESILLNVGRLQSLPFASLSPQSQHLLSLPREKHSSFIKQHSEVPVHKMSIVTCLTTLNINSKEKDSVASLVLGTENGEILILDPQTFTVMHQARVSAEKCTPSHLQSCGLFDVEYRILIATREGLICVLRREWLEGKCLIQLSSLVVDFIIFPGDNSIVVACTDKTLHCYTKKGKKNWMVSLVNSITTITLVPLLHLGANLIGVSMIGGLIQFYNGKNLVDSIQMQDTISTMKFGQIGQEEHVLALISSDGALILKILKRTADFNLFSAGNIQKTHPSLLAAQQARPLLVPKKSKLFLEQASREREQSIVMHETFQKELCQLRLTVAKATVDAMKNANCSVSSGSTEPLKLSAQVQGLGPVFKVHLSIENLSAETAVTHLSLLLIADHRYYKIFSPFIMVPMLVSGHPFTFISRVADLFFVDDSSKEDPLDLEESDLDLKSILKVILLKEGQVQPLLAATIHIPATDPLMIPFV